MHVGEDVLVTKAILDASDYLRNSERIAAATAKFMDSSRTSKAASSLTALGVPLTALSANAIKTAASFQQQEKAFGGLLGSADRGKAMFKELAGFTTKTPFQLSDWTQATRTLLGWGMAADQIMPSLKALGNSEAAMGRTGADLQRAAYELGEMGSGFLSMKQVRNLMMDGVPAAAALKKELHLTGEELANIGKMHIDGKLGVAAIQKYIAESNLGTGMEQQMGTLNGSITSLRDNWNIFLASAGQPALKPLTDLTNKAAELLGTFQQLPQATQEGIGKAVLYSGPALLAAGAGLKALDFWRDLRNAKNLAKIATVAEDAAEKAKLTTFGSEAQALDTATGKWKGLGTAVSDIPTLLKGIPGAAKAALTALGSVVGFQGAAEGATGLAKLGGSGLRAATGTLGAGLAGGLILSLPAIVAAGFANAIEHEKMDQADQQMRGYGAADLSPIINRIAKDRAGLRKNPNDPKLLHDLKMEQDMMARLSGHTARAKALHTAAAKAGGHTGNALIDDFLKNKGKSLHQGGTDRGTEGADFALDEAETRMKIAQINFEHDKLTGGGARGRHGKTSTIHGPRGREGLDTETSKAMEDHKAYNAARLEALGLIDKSIAAHEKYAGSLAHVAGKAHAWLTEEKAILSLKEKRAELDHDDLIKKGAGGFDKTMATIISSAGLSEEEILKRTGIGRKSFAAIGKGSLPHDPLTDLLHKGIHGKPLASPVARMVRAAVNQPVHIHIELGGKELKTVTATIENAVVKQIVQVLEGSHLHTIAH